LINKTKALEITEELPKLPVARVFGNRFLIYILQQKPGFWQVVRIIHVTVRISAEQLEDFAEIAGIESLVIDEDTKMRDFKNTLRWNEIYYR
jgi:L-arabinose isomerase